MNLPAYRAYAVRVEIYCEGDTSMCAVLETQDEACASVQIKTAVTPESWADLSLAISHGLKSMQEPL